jgi:hypothetical protein
MTREQRKAMRDLANCRTAALGGHVERCDCGYERPVYNSCGNRNCPVCLGIRARRWLKQRIAELLPVPYFHCVFTLPDTFNPLIPAAPVVFYRLLFRAMWGTVKCLAQRYGYGTPGVIAVLHTWGQTLWLHPHIHALITGGGLRSDGRAWLGSKPDFLFDVYEMSREFRTRFCRLLRCNAAKFATAPVDAAALADSEEQREWVVYCKRPLSGAPKIVAYLARYSHRTAISDRRIEDVSEAGVTFAWKDYRHADADGRAPNRSLLLTGIEFIRRFLQHILPANFKRMRFFGIYAGNCRRRKLSACRGLVGRVRDNADDLVPERDPDELRRCPYCGKLLRAVREIAPEHRPPLVLPVSREAAHAA